MIELKKSSELGSVELEFTDDVVAGVGLGLAELVSLELGFAAGEGLAGVGLGWVSLELGFAAGEGLAGVGLGFASLSGSSSAGSAVIKELLTAVEKQTGRT